MTAWIADHWPWLVGVSVVAVGFVLWCCLRVSGEYDREMQRRYQRDLDDAGWEDGRRAD